MVEKGIVHRDMKPQNLLLCNPPGRKSKPSPTEMILKIGASSENWLSVIHEGLCLLGFESRFRSNNQHCSCRLCLFSQAVLDLVLRNFPINVTRSMTLAALQLYLEGKVRH